MSDAACKKTAVVGFDGAVDTRAKVIKKGEESGYYSSVPDFGLDLAAHAGKNCSRKRDRCTVPETVSKGGSSGGRELERASICRKALERSVS